ncbi:uncharacterized protein BDR25DRAFT_361447 [Lindgomyces ingoldianus]|uniref:Uncharacterized protein n=1 Tax=Lindgomyces ingoldianus TaxID=673940 RepID=A0ACB6QCB4_9PLEO|nr:uncharacterized protein BDR25DRAFT_361447 [Lindgomyces ingoldianus]KAF2464608.1 hypothetical protein BDR25DRAFT_361447 [Lindgomyces ingoldianus]
MLLIEGIFDAYDHSVPLKEFQTASKPRLRIFNGWRSRNTELDHQHLKELYASNILCCGQPSVSMRRFASPTEHMKSRAEVTERVVSAFRFVFHLAYEFLEARCFRIQYRAVTRVHNALNHIPKPLNNCVHSTQQCPATLKPEKWERNDDLIKVAQWSLTPEWIPKTPTPTFIDPCDPLFRVPERNSPTAVALARFAGHTFAILEFGSYPAAEFGWGNNDAY